MPKEKKITIDYIPVKNRGDKDTYTIYCNVIYNRKNTKFSLNISYPASSMASAKKILPTLIKDFPINLSKQKIEKYIRYEKFKAGDDYSIVGLKKRIGVYQYLLLDKMVGVIFNTLLFNLEDWFSYKEYKEFKALDKKYKFYSVEFLIKILDQLMRSNDNKNPNIFSKLDPVVINFIIFIGYFGAFEIERSHFQQQSINNSITKFSKSWFKEFPGDIVIGSWLINENGVKSDFNEFINITKSKTSIYLSRYNEPTFDKFLKSSRAIMTEDNELFINSLESIINDMTEGKKSLSLIIAA